jgi:hypothetical protein
MRTVEDDSYLNGAQKKKELDYLQREINSLYKEVVLEIKKSKTVRR